MDVQTYLDQVRAQYESGHATEHSYRPALHGLFKSIDPALTVINEPKKSEAGMPDFLFQRGDVPLGWAEAKDIDKDVIKLKGYSIEQRRRYERAYPNLIYTNGVDFEFIREAQGVHFVSIASFLGPLGGLQPLPEKFEELERQLKLFAEQKPISIRTAQQLAEMMAAKAAIIKDELEIALSEDKELRSALAGQFKSFKANLLPALTADEFADLYAETITYGNSLESSSFLPVDIKAPHFGFLQRDHDVGEQYNSGILIPELFPIGGTGTCERAERRAGRASDFAGRISETSLAWPRSTCVGSGRLGGPVTDGPLIIKTNPCPTALIP